MPTRIKRYEDRAENLEALIKKIEDEMGQEAQLELREYRRGALLGFIGGKKMVEVIATLKISGGGDKPTKPVVPVVPQARPAPPPVEQIPPPPPAPEPAQPELSTTKSRAKKSRLEDDSLFQTAAAQPEAPAPDAAVVAAAAELAGMRDSISQLGAAVIELAGFQQQALKAGAEAAASAPDTASQERQHIDTAKLVEISTSIAGLQNAVAQLAEGRQETPAQPADSPALGEIRQSIAVLQEAVSEMAEAQRAASEQPAGPDPAEELRLSIEQDREHLQVINQSVDGLRSTVNEFIADQRRAAGEQAKSKPVLEPASILPILHRETYGRLIDWGISPDDATGLIYRALDSNGLSLLTEAELIGKVKGIICNETRVTGELRPGRTSLGRVMALVGATGVGKTTTIAKLAAHHAFQQERQVSLISLDNYRVAAAEQLRRYCDIMGLPLEVVFTPQDYAAAVESRHNDDLILLDTAGRSPRNAGQVDELLEFFVAHPPDETHLVLAAATNAGDLRTILDNFAPLEFSRIIVSKLDETGSLGCLHNLAKLSTLPISYFTTGQNVPEDLASATTEFIRNWFEV